MTTNEHADYPLPTTTTNYSRPEAQNIESGIYPVLESEIESATSYQAIWYSGDEKPMLQVSATDASVYKGHLAR